MPRNATTGVFARVSNSFSSPVFGTLIDPSDAEAYFDDLDVGLNPPELDGPVRVINSLQVGTTGSAAGTIDFLNATSGVITLSPPAGALGTRTLTLPAATDTLVGKATTDTLTNKTLTSPVLTTPDLGTPSALVGTNITGTAAGLTAGTFTAGSATNLTSGTLPAGRYSSSTAIRSALGVGGKPLGFRATKGGTDQTGVVDSTFTLVTFGTEDFDQGSFFASNTWTPPAGLVKIEAVVSSVGVNQTAGLLSIASLYKNGVRFKDFVGGPITAGQAYSMSVSVTDVANGTDAYTVQVFLDTSPATTGTVSGLATGTYFSGIVYPD